MDTTVTGKELEKLLDCAFEALSTERDSLDVVIRRDGNVDIVKIEGQLHRLPPDRNGRLLAWEKIFDLLPPTVERYRLKSMHDAIDRNWAAPWSVYTTATSVAWLQRSVGGAGTARWRDLMGQILAAADNDGSLKFASSIESSPSMYALLRSRRLRANFSLNSEIRYDANVGGLIISKPIPETLALGIKGLHLADVVDLPWLRELGVTIAKVIFENDGTTLLLDEACAPLEPIPDAARRAAPRDGPPYAPWLVTKAEQLALDEIDAMVHGNS